MPILTRRAKLSNARSLIKGFDAVHKSITDEMKFHKIPSNKHNLALFIPPPPETLHPSPPLVHEAIDSD